MKFDKLETGMVLYDVHSHKMGNTTMSTLGCWRVLVIQLDKERRRALCSWNGNKPSWYTEKGIEKLKAKEPILISSGFGMRRRATREEIKAMKASQS